jgi:MFS family permease
MAIAKNMIAESGSSLLELRKVVVGASLGTVFEWYDFFLYALLASILAQQFFSGVNETAAFILTLLSFAAGTAIRPLGAIVFGHFGDLIGRKRTFLVTMILMGVATFFIGLLPNYATWGALAAFLLVTFRLLQGFALGGEYGGAAIYVAEHAPPARRGFFTSWIQITTPLGQLLAMVVIFGVQSFIRPEDFASWGWRIPFLLAIVILAISIWIRMSMLESPVFQKLQAEGKLSRAPLKETFLEWKNLKMVLLALFGLAAGQAVVISVAMTYSFFFLVQTLKVDLATVNILLAIALVVTAPFFVIFGALSDRSGRKIIIMTGIVLAAVCYRPVFQGLTHYANPALEAAQASSPVTVTADPKDCSFQFNPVNTAQFRSSCDLAKSFLARNGVPYSTVDAPSGTIASIRIKDSTIQSFDGTILTGADFRTRTADFNKTMAAAIAQVGYPPRADVTQINKPMVVILLSLLMLFATMVYGPMAALLVEMFPPQIRYSSISTAYHIGNGWFGGFTSPIAFTLIAATGDIYAGLWYCIAVGLLTFVVGTFLVAKRAPYAVEGPGVSLLPARH